MDIIMDTHAFLWYAKGDARLSGSAKELIDDISNGRYLSIASLWEMAIKYSNGKLELSPSYKALIPEVISKNRFEVLSAELPHTIQVAQLGFPNRNHRDSFDRFIIAQSAVEDIPVVSSDNKLDYYPVTRIW